MAIKESEVQPRGDDCCKILLNIPNASWPIVGQAWSYQEVYGDLCIAVDAPALVCRLSPLVLVPSKTSLAQAMGEILVALVVKDRERQSNIKVRGPDMAILGGLNSWLIDE